MGLFYFLLLPSPPYYRKQDAAPTLGSNAQKPLCSFQSARWHSLEQYLASLQRTQVNSASDAPSEGFLLLLPQVLQPTARRQGRRPQSLDFPLSP